MVNFFSTQTGCCDCAAAVRTAGRCELAESKAYTAKSSAVAFTLPRVADPLRATSAVPIKRPARAYFGGVPGSLIQRDRRFKSA